MGAIVRRWFTRGVGEVGEVSPRATRRALPLPPSLAPVPRARQVSLPSRRSPWLHVPAGHPRPQPRTPSPNSREARDAGHTGAVEDLSHEDIARFLASAEAATSAHGGAKRQTSVNAVIPGCSSPRFTGHRKQDRKAVWSGSDQGISAHAAPAKSAASVLPKGRTALSARSSRRPRPCRDETRADGRFRW